MIWKSLLPSGLPAEANIRSPLSIRSEAIGPCIYAFQVHSLCFSRGISNIALRLRRRFHR
jgi:hypothetical protein